MSWSLNRNKHMKFNRGLTTIYRYDSSGKKSQIYESSYHVNHVTLIQFRTVSNDNGV